MLAWLINAVKVFVRISWIALRRPHQCGNAAQLRWFSLATKDIKDYQLWSAFFRLRSFLAYPFDVPFVISIYSSYECGERTSPGQWTRLASFVQGKRVHPEMFRNYLFTMSCDLHLTDCFYWSLWKLLAFSLTMRPKSQVNPSFSKRKWMLSLVSAKL